MITEQYIPCRYFSQVYDGTHVMAGHCGGGSTSIVGTRKEKDSLCALPEPSIVPCSGARDVGYTSDQ